MEPPFLPIFYRRRRQPTLVILRDEQVESTCIEQLRPSIVEAISCAVTESVSPDIDIWKLKEPLSCAERLPAYDALEEIAELFPVSSRISPYVHPHSALVSLVIEWQPIVPKGEKRTFEAVEAGSVVREDTVDRTKRTKVDPPSTMAQPSKFREFRSATGSFIVDHRLADGVEYLPNIALQYRGFGYFLDFFRGRNDVPGIDKISPSDIRLAVDDFAEKMAPMYPNERARMLVGLAALNNILSTRTDNLFLQVSETSVSDMAVSDGCTIGPHQVAFCVVVFKNEPTGNCIPYAEMMGYFMHSAKESFKESKPEAIARGWDIPCLGLTIVGPCVTFYALVLSEGYRVVTLTPGLSCIRASGGGDDRKALYKAFTAASVLLACIKEEATQLVEASRLPARETRHLPSISKLTHPSGPPIEFKILKRVSFIVHNRHVYIAQAGDKKIVVKFTERYSYELHMFCATRNLAPRLLAFEKLPGGFFGVAMDYFEHSLQIREFSASPKVPQWSRVMLELVRAFHEAGFVHGDLRSPNILCDGGKVMLVDFDWGGKEREVSYPEDPLNPELTDGRPGGSTDLRITKADDLRVLHNTLRFIGFTV